MFTRIFLTALLVYVSTISFSQTTQQRFWKTLDPGSDKSSLSVIEQLKQNKVITENDSLVMTHTDKDKRNVSHVTFIQYHNGIQVKDAQISFHSKNGALLAYNGKLINFNNELPSKAINVSEEEVITIARNNIDAEKFAWEDEKFEKLITKISGGKTTTLKPQPKLTYFKVQNTYKLCYEVEVFTLHPHGRFLLFIDALNGDVLEKIEMLQHATGSCATVHHGTQDIDFDMPTAGLYELTDNTRNIETYVISNGQTSYNGSHIPTSTVTDWSGLSPEEESALDVHWGTEVVYDILQSEGLTSFDNNGSLITSYTNYGYNFNSSNNAFWNGFFLTYGKGGSTTFPESVTTLDVVAHEIGHAVTEFYGNGLYYQGESGAINESISDMLAAIVEMNVNNSSNFNGLSLDQWVISDLNGNGIRDLSNPNSFNQPDTYNGNHWASTTSSYDNGGVHTNSGVANYWFYLLINGGSGVNDNGYSYNVPPLTSSLSDITQLILNSYSYMNDNPSYQDFRDATIMSVQVLYNNCNMTQKVIEAWNAVGVGDPNQGCSSILMKIRNHQTQFCSGDTNTFYNEYIPAPGYSYFWELDGAPVTMPVTFPGEGISTLTLIAENNSTGDQLKDSIDLYLFECDSVKSHNSIWYYGHQQGVDFSKGIAMPASYPYTNFESTTMLTMDGEMVYYVSATPTGPYDYEMDLLDKNHNSLANLNPVYSSSFQIGATAINPDTTGGHQYANLYVNASHQSLVSPGTCSGLYRIVVDVIDPNNPVFISKTPVPAPSNFPEDPNGAYCAGDNTSIIPGCNPNIFWLITAGNDPSNSTSVFKLDFSAGNAIPHGVLTLNASYSSVDYTLEKRISPNGEYIVIRGRKLFKFDREFGTITFLENFPPGANSKPGAFSPNSQFYYTSRDNKVYQYDVLASDFQGSEAYVGDAPAYSELGNENTSLATGPDGRVYISFVGQVDGPITITDASTRETGLGVINEPNKKEINGDVKYNKEGYYFPQSGVSPFRQTLPVFRDAKLAEEELLTLSYTQESCNTFNFMAPSCKSYYTWSFGDGDSLVNAQDYQTSHTYASSGTYTLSLTSHFNGTDTTIYETIDVILLDSVEIIAPNYVCDAPFSVVHGTPGYADYQWDILSGAATLQNPSQESTGITWDTTGVVELQLTVTSFNGCSKSITKTIHVVDADTPPVVNNSDIDTLSYCTPFTPATPTATDKCGNILQGSPSVTLPITSQGTTTITWTYTDVDGLSVTQDQTITFTQIDDGVTQNLNILTANQNGFSYQWIDCDSGNPIPGATDQTFQATSVGNYAVVIDNGSCSVTSDCIEVDGIAGFEKLTDSQIKLFPNPSKGRFMIQTRQNIQYEIFNSNGKLVKTGTQKEVDLTNTSFGTYFINIYDQDKRLIHVDKIVIN